MRQTFRFLMFMALPIVLGLASCTEHDNPVDNDQVTTDIDPTSVNEFKPEVFTMASLWVAPGVDADLKQAFDWGTATTESTPEEGSVLVLNKLTDVSEAVLQNALENGGPEYLICVVNPDKAEFEAYAESHDWFDVEADNVTDSTFIYGFNAVNRRYIIQKPVTEEGADPVLENINRAQNYYVYISAMLNDFGRSQQNGSNDKEDGKTSMEDFASHYHYAVTKTFNVEKTFREVLWSSADKLSGSFTATANYDVYMVHVYEGEPGEGDYYGVRMTASIASANMWKGKGDNTHGGVHVRWCGAYCTDFFAVAHIVSGTPSNYNWDEDTSDKIIFTAGGFPSPSTTTGSTTYQDKNSFSLSMSQSIGGSAGKNSKGKSKDIEAQFSFSESWEWSHTETRDINDVDIINVSRGNIAGWQLQFNNLPEYKFSESKGFKEGDNKAARGTMEIHGSWLWYDKTGKDNQDRTPWLLCTWLEGRYEIQSFITTEADLDKTNIVGADKFIIQLPKMVNATAGQLKIKNDLPDGMTLSNVKVYTTDDIEVNEFENTVPNGGEQVLGAFNTKYQYIVTFKGRTSDGKTSYYKYTLNPSIKLSHKAMTTVYANSDFTAVTATD